MLRGRRTERDMLDRLLESVSDMRCGVLTLHGEPGIGKTALLEYTIQAARGFRVVRAAGVESEMQLPYAGLQQLCAPLLDRLDRLPAPQRAALEVAFGLTAGSPPDRFLVGLAVLSLLSEVAQEQPLLCVVDDGQWLDRESAQALAFAARRLLAERVALLFAAREPSDDLRNAPRLHIEGLPDADARALLDSVPGVPVDEHVRERFVAETRGNPLALLELSRWLSTDQLAGGFGIPIAQSLPGKIEESFQQRLDELPAETQRLLLIAAAEPVGDPAVLWRAGERLGITPEAAVPAVDAGLVTVTARVTFRHPLVRSAIYGGSSPDQRRIAHQALAETTDPDTEPDRHAWHRAQAARGPDEEVAVELEHSASRAQARGGFAAAAAFLEAAVALTVDPRHRAHRLLDAARARHQAGGLDAALGLLAAAEVGSLDERQRAEVDLLRARISFDSNRGREASRLLLNAANRLEPLDSKVAREIYLDALAAAVFAGRLAEEGQLQALGEAVRRLPAAAKPKSADLLLEGFAVLVTEGRRGAAPTLKQALNGFSPDSVSDEQAIRWLWVASTAAGLLWDYELWDELSDRLVRVARAAGALRALPIGLNTRAGALLLGGDPTAAASMAEEASAIADVTGSSIAPYATLALVAFQGREAEALELIDSTRREVLRRGEGGGLTFVHWAAAVLHNGSGRYQDALAAARQATEDDADLNTSRFHSWGLVELIEAATRSGEHDEAATALMQLTEITGPSGTDWARGVQARCQALVADGDAAETFHRQAIEVLEQTRVPVEQARAHLLYGEWLRRERRRLDAREQLRRAYAMFGEFGMEAFARRARGELEATGEHTRERTVATRDELTPQEAQISRLAAEGATNQEIAARLFISPSTVDYHLRKAFRKLGVRSRTQLVGQVLASAASVHTTTNDR